MLEGKGPPSLSVARLSSYLIHVVYFGVELQFDFELLKQCVELFIYSSFLFIETMY